MNHSPDTSGLLKGNKLKAGRPVSAATRRRLSRAARIRGEVARIARLRANAEAKADAEQCGIVDALERLRLAEPRAAQRLIDHVHGRNAVVSLGAIRELFDRTRGKPAQTVNTQPARVAVTVITGVPRDQPVRLEVDQATASQLLPAPAESEPAE